MAFLVKLLFFHHAQSVVTTVAAADRMLYICSSEKGSGLMPNMVRIWLIRAISITIVLNIVSLETFFTFDTPLYNIYSVVG